MKNKKWFIIPILAIIVAVIVAVAWYASSTKWTRDFEIKYVEFVNLGRYTTGTDYSHYTYEITNNTHHTLKDVWAVIQVDTYGDDFEYRDFVSYSIKAGETVTYKVYVKDYTAKANDLGIDLGYKPSVDIVKIEYSK